MSYKIPEWQLPTELQHYAKGTSDFPRGNYSPLEVKSAIKYRQTFFRRLQAYRSGLQYQWPDYIKLMWQEILAYSKRVLRPRVMARWDELAGHNSRLGTVYSAEENRKLRNSGPMRLAQRERLKKEARERAFISAIQDPRTLGLLEEAILGDAIYGIPSRPQHIAH